MSGERLVVGSAAVGSNGGSGPRQHCQCAPETHPRELGQRFQLSDRRRLVARAPVAESRLRYDADRAEVELVSDRRWAELLRLVYKVEIEACPRCGGAMTVLGFITEQPVVRRILAHLECREVDARAGPWTGAAAAPG